MQKLAVVSGGTRGIGKAIVEQFAKNGFDIVVSARKEADLFNLKVFIEKKYAVKCFIKQADLSIKANVFALADFTLSLNRTVDVLVNNAGTFIPGNVHEEADGIL